MSIDHCQIPVQTFFEEFLPSNIDFQLPNPQPFGFTVEDFRPNANVSFVQRLCDTLNDWLATSQLPYVVKYTGGNNVPTLCVYGASDVARQTCLPGIVLQDPDGVVRNVAAVAWAWVIVVIDVDVQPEEHEADTQREADALDSMLDRQRVHARKIMQYQHRRHVFTILIQGHKLRFAFWDRAGVVISDSLDYLENPDVLFKFVFALASSTPTAMGYDETVTLAEPGQIRILERYAPSLEHPASVRTELLQVRDAILGGSEHDRTISPIYCVKCHDTEYRTSAIPQDLRTFAYLISGSNTVHRPLLGIGTRGFFAFDVDHNNMVYMKDNWILEDLGGKNELGVYEILFKAKVRFVPTALAGGLVEAQETLSQSFYIRMGNGLCRKRRHCRLVVAQIGRLLWDFKDTRELVSALNDALIAHQDAHELGRMLHRNVSAETILINIITGKGYLVDWDLAVSLDIAPSEPRAGTWEYLSALLQTYARKPNALSDDLESFAWSLVLPVARFVPNERSCVRYEADGAYIDFGRYNHRLLDFVNNVFHLKFVVGVDISGGEYKIEQIVRRNNFGFRPLNSSGPLAKLLRGLHALLHEFYVSLDEAELEAQGGIPGNEFAYPALSWKGAIPQSEVRSDCLDTHTRIRALFSEVLDDPSLEWTDERTVDQFAGAFFGIYNLTPSEAPIQHAKAKRHHSSDSEDSDSDSEPEPEPKRVRLHL